MNKVPLGRSDIYVTRACLGGNTFGWTADEGRSFEILDAFVDANFNFIDTADVYSSWAPGSRGGESETIIGKWLKQSGKRHQVVLATKVGWEMPGVGKGLAARHIVRSVEDSLQRLQTDHIDLYYSHLDDSSTPLEETLAAFAKLLEQGKIRLVGASNYSAPRLREALEVSARLGLPRYEVIQPPYNLMDRAKFEAELAGLIIEHGLGSATYYGVARGFLTGKYRSKADLSQSPRGARVADYMDARGMRVLAALDEIAAATGTTPTQVSLAWLLSRPAVTAPITSVTRKEQLGDIIGAARLVLDRGALDRLDHASSLQ